MKTQSKTFKRELAVAMLLWLAYVVEVKEPNLVEILVWPVFTFTMAAFGFDQYAKLQQPPSQITHGRGTERSSQRPSGENKLPDARNDQNGGTEDK